MMKIIRKKGLKGKKPGISLFSVIILFSLTAILFLASCENPTLSPNSNRTPVVLDYDISGLTQTFDGSPKAVTITPKAGKSTGARIIYYEGTGSTTYPKTTLAPTAAGMYTVTFSVAAAAGWNAASGLYAGILTITSQNVTNETCEFVIELAGMNEWELTEQIVNVSANTDKTFTVAGDYNTYRWVLDGTSVGTSPGYTFNKPAGVYQLAVVVTNSAGESRSGRCRVTVLANGGIL